MNKTKKLVLASALTALIAVMAFTPLGYLKVGIFSITFLSVPVAIGAILLGQWYGLFLGLVFGLTSFVQCFGMDAFGTVLCGINWFGMFVTTIITRAVMGFLTGLLFRIISKKDEKKLVSMTVSTVVAGVLNTLLFTGSLLLFFRNADLAGFSEGLSFADMSVWKIVLFVVALNPLVEIPVCAFIGTVISKTLYSVVPKFEKGRKL